MINIKVTETELEAIKTAIDNISAYIGGYCEEAQKEAEWIIKHADKMFDRNNIKRDFK